MGRNKQMNDETIPKLAEEARVTLERGENSWILIGWDPLPKTDMMMRSGASYSRAHDIPPEARSDPQTPEIFVCAAMVDGDDDAVIFQAGHKFYDDAVDRTEMYLRRIAEARRVEERRTARVVMLDQSFVDALFELNHRGPKNQAWTIRQSDSLKGNFSAHFPIGHTPSAEQCYFCNIKKDVRMTLKSSASMYSGLTGQSLIADAIAGRDYVFAKYLAEEDREAYLMLIESEDEPNPAAVINRAAEFSLCRPVHQVIRNMVRRKVMPPYSSTKDVLRFIPIECETPPAWRVWYFAEAGRACFSRPGATQATPEIPEDVITIHFQSVSATGSHWTDHWVLLGEPVPIPIVIDKTSNAGNESQEEKTFLHTKGYQPTSPDEETRVKDGVTEHMHTGYEFWHPVVRVHSNTAE